MKTFLEQFFSLLNGSYEYAVLRNYETLPEKLESRDIDILICRRDFRRFQKELPELLNSTQSRILYTFEDHQFYTLVLLDSDYQILQIDFQFNFAWMGLDLLDERKVLAKRMFNGKVYHLPPDFTFLPKYLYCRILGAKYPEKYAAIREAAVNSNGSGINALLKKLSGLELEQWDKTGKWSLRFRSFCGALRQRPLRAVGALLRFIGFYLRNLLFQRGLMISFSGPDGCGKSTVIELLKARFESNPPELFHFRPTLFPNLGEAAHKAGVVKTVDRNFDQPHRAKRHGAVNSLLRLGYYATDYVIGYVVKILPLRQRKRIIFFDRYFTDIIADSERSGIFLNYKFLTFLRHFIPGCQINFLFKVEPEQIRKRKKELEIEDMERIYIRLEYLASHDKHYVWIDNNGTPEEAVKQILWKLAAVHK